MRPLDSFPLCMVSCLYLCISPTPLPLCPSVALSLGISVSDFFICERVTNVETDSPKWTWCGSGATANTKRKMMRSPKQANHFRGWNQQKAQRHRGTEAQRHRGRTVPASSAKFATIASESRGPRHL
ncbi:hypothetical protein GE21DRAFT_1285785 [Neurospora crassa]|nr:hypothetical protein GE21DRAFT_1285785 [Neurospora crassa]